MTDELDTQMDVLISWSGRQSRQVAEVLSGWLPEVIPTLQPWISTQDIDKGKRWFSELQAYLNTAKACIVCLTPENIDSPWLYWETGAIALTQEHPIYPLLINITPDDIKQGPLAQFQCAYNRKDDLWLLVRSLNGCLDKPEDDMRLKGVFETHWDKLYSAFRTVAEIGVPRSILLVLKGLEATKKKFARRWESDSNADSWEPIKQLVSDTNIEIEHLLTQEGVERRIKLHCTELKRKVERIASAGTRQAAHQRGAAIFSDFDRAIEAIRADYEQIA